MLKFSGIEVEQPNEKTIILHVKCFVLYLFKILFIIEVSKITSILLILEKLLPTL